MEKIEIDGKKYYVALIHKEIWDESSTVSDRLLTDAIQNSAMVILKDGNLYCLQEEPFPGWKYNEKLGRNVNMAFECECDDPDFNVTHHAETDGFLTTDKYMLTTCCKKRVEYEVED